MRPAGPVRALSLVACLAVTAGLAGCGPGGTPPSPTPARGTSASRTTSTSGGSAAAGGAATAGGITARLAPYRLSAPLSREVVLAAGGRLRILGGLDSGQQTVGGVFDLDPVTGTLSEVGRLARSVHDAAGVVIGGTDLVMGGGSPGTVATVQRFDTPGGGSLVGDLPRPRSDLVAATVAGRAYVLGGYDGTTGDPAVLATTDGRSFVPVASLVTPVRYPAVAVVGGRIYLFGGGNSSGSADTSDIQEVDPATGRVRVVGHLPVALAHAAATVSGGRVYVLGGDIGTTATAGIERFDPATGRVGPAGQLPEAVSDAGVATVAGTTYLVGGESAGRALATVIEVRPAR